MKKGILEVVNPVARVHLEASRVPNPRPRDFRGRILGLLDTRKPNADLFMDRIQELLQTDRFGFDGIIRRRKPTIANEPTPRGMIAELAERCDIVIHGIGD